MSDVLGEIAFLIIVRMIQLGVWLVLCLGITAVAAVLQWIRKKADSLGNKNSCGCNLNVNDASQLERYYKDSNEVTLKIQMALGDIIPADLVLNIDWDTIF